MYFLGYAANGFSGEIVRVQVDIRRGIPGVDIVGLPDSAVKEARERVRVSIRNSGFIFPQDRILINLSPADLRKEGSSFDLSIAMAILTASGQVINQEIDIEKSDVMVLGELDLAGTVRPVRGVLHAVLSGLSNGISRYIVPKQNMDEACLAKGARVNGVNTLAETVDIIGKSWKNVDTHLKAAGEQQTACMSLWENIRELRGQPVLRRALEIGACGRHHMFFFGPPGSGKTMAAHCLPSLLPPLSEADSLDVARIYSLAGSLGVSRKYQTSPPFRMPHHSASEEGIIGGGKPVLPGEVSLAHKGVLFLDEVTEFRKNMLQCLREPLESGKVEIARAESRTWFPADFQLVMAANPCPCGNLGRGNGICICSKQELYRYWNKLGGALLDRIDIRVPVTPIVAGELFSNSFEDSHTIRERIISAKQIQKNRFRCQSFQSNAGIPSGKLFDYCFLDTDSQLTVKKVAQKLCFSSRAIHSAIRVARTIADLAESESIKKEHLLEAVQHRRYGDTNYYWRT